MAIESLETEIDAFWLDDEVVFVNSYEKDIYAGTHGMAQYIFDNHMGAAFYFTYQDDIVRVAKANSLFYDELIMEQGLKQLGGENDWRFASEKEKGIFIMLLNTADEGKQEAIGEVWFRSFSQCCSYQEQCISFHIHLAAVSGSSKLYYGVARNITDGKLTLQDLSASEHKFRSAAEQANIYAWEYNIATKEMRPCSRCMRDLNMPAIVENYPEPVIASGLFPADYADMYRQWHKRLADGEPQLEAIIPLTADRIPFHVRYTTEFDKDGRPVKAFGSATLAIDNEQELQLKEIISSLSMKYTTVIKLNLTTGGCEALNIGDETSVLIQNYYFANKSFTWKEILDNYCFEYVHPDDRKSFQQELNLEMICQHLKEQKDYTLTYRILRKKEPHYMQMRIFSMADKKHVVVTAQNVDEMMRLQLQSEEELKHKLELMRSYASMNYAMLTNMAWDLCHGLDTLREQAHQVSKQLNLPENLIHRVNWLEQEVRTLAGEIVSVGDNGMNGQENEPGVFDIATVFQALAKQAEPFAKEKDLDFDFEVVKGELKPTMVKGNRLHVQRILQNVVRNAIDYCQPEGEVHCSLEITPRDDKVIYKYKVSDEGIGISDEFQRRMFEPFTREHEDDVTITGKRRGLGLYVAKQLLDNMDGSISVYSASNLGTIVTITLPMPLAIEEQNK